MQNEGTDSENCKGKEAQDRQTSEQFLTEDVTKKKRTNAKMLEERKKENTAFWSWTSWLCMKRQETISLSDNHRTLTQALTMM